MSRLLPGRARLAWLAALAILPVLVAVDPAAAGGPGGAGALAPGPQVDEPVDREIELARLGYRSGVRVVFSRDEVSGDFGLREDGEIGRNAPVVGDREENML